MLRILIGINNDFQISVPHHSTHYTLQGTGDMFNTVNNKRHPRLISPTNHFPRTELKNSQIRSNYKALPVNKSAQESQIPMLHIPCSLYKCRQCNKLSKFNSTSILPKCGDANFQLSKERISHLYVYFI